MKTEDLIKAAPEGAIFVWCTGQLAYPRYLAAQLGRKDLKIEGPAFFDLRVERWKGITRPIVLDGDAVANFDKLQFAGYQAYLGRPAPRAAKIA